MPSVHVLGVWGVGRSGKPQKMGCVSGWGLDCRRCVRRSLGGGVKSSAQGCVHGAAWVIGRLAAVLLPFVCAMQCPVSQGGRLHGGSWLMGSLMCW